MQKIFGNYLQQYSAQRRILITRVLLAAILLMVSAAVAQTGQGTINGRVSDPKGAVVPDAQVVITNNDTGVQNSTTTNEEGIYNVPSLNPGTYSITVARQGFKRTLVDNVIVSAADSVEMDVSLSVGTENISVTVTAQDALLSNTSDVSTTVDHELVENLPYPERSSLEAVLLVPGVNGDPLNRGGIDPENAPYTVGPVTPGASIAVGGTPPGLTSIMIDGSDVTQASWPRAGVNLSGMNVGESTVIVSGIPAKYGRTGSGVIIQSSRPGTDQFHGRASWLHSDPYLDAWPDGGTIPNGIHQNFFGLDIGGPVWLPKLYNGRHKTFFFVGVEPARLANSFGARAAFLTPDDFAGHLHNNLAFLNQTVLKSSGYAAALAAPRIAGAGVFYQAPVSGPTNCPSVPAGFPCGKQYTSTSSYTEATGPQGLDDISSQLAANPLASFVAANMPTPSNPGPYVHYDSPDGAFQSDLTNGYYRRGVSNTDNRYSFRIDQQFDNSNRLFVRYTVIPLQAFRYLAFPYDNPMNASPVNHTTTHNVAIGYTHIFTNNLVATGHYSWLRVFSGNYLAASALSQDWNTKLGLTPATLGKGFPYLTGFASVSGASYGISGAGGGGGTEDIDQNLIGGADFSWTHGAHLIQFGFDLRWIQSSQYDNSGLTGGHYNFVGSQSTGPSGGSGTGWASFILGLINSYQTTPVSVPGYYRYRYYGGYIQDDWRATSRLTLNLGLRYDIETPRIEKFNNQAFVAQTSGTLNGLPVNAAFCFSEVCGFSRTMWPVNYKGVQPRVGVSYAPTRRTTIRASYAMTRLPLAGQDSNAANGTDPDFNVSSASIGTQSGGVTAGYLVDNVSNPVGTVSSAFTALNGQRGPFYYSTGIAPVFVDQSNKVPYIQGWNLTIQYQPALKTVLQATYQGVNGTHLIGPFTNPINTAPIGTVITAIQQGAYLGGGGTPNPYGIANPGTTTPINETNLQRLYPYQNFFNQSLNEIYPRDGVLHYNGMYVSVNQRFTGNLAALANYTWSKSLDDVPDTTNATGGGFGTSAPQNPFNLAGEYSVSGFDQPSRLKAGYTYKLPFGTGQRFATGHRVIDQIIGNLGTSGIMTSASGYPNYISLGGSGYFTSLTPGGTQGCTAKAGTYCTSTVAPNGFTFRPSFVPGQPLINPQWKKNPYTSSAGIQPYLNPNAFTVPGSPNNPVLGNVPRTLAGARTPREFFFDANANKGFTVHERYQVAINMTVSNVFNHPVYYAVSQHNVFSSTTVNTTTGAITQTINAAFGDLAAQSSGISRTVQFGAMVTF